MSAKETNNLQPGVPVKRETLHSQLEGTNYAQVHPWMWGWNYVLPLYHWGHRLALETLSYSPLHNGVLPIKGPDGYEGDKKKLNEEDIPAHIRERDAKVFPKQNFETKPQWTMRGIHREQHETPSNLMSRAWSGPYATKEHQSRFNENNQFIRLLWEFSLYTTCWILGFRYEQTNSNYNRQDTDSNNLENHLYKSLYAKPGMNTPCHPVVAPSTDLDMRGEMRTDNFRFPKYMEPGHDGNHIKLEKHWRLQDSARNINKQVAANYVAAKEDNQASGGMVSLPGAITWGMNRNQGVVSSKEEEEGAKE